LRREQALTSNLKTLSAGVPKKTGRMPVPPWKPGPAFALLCFGAAGTKHRTLNIQFEDAFGGGAERDRQDACATLGAGTSLRAAVLRRGRHQTSNIQHRTLNIEHRTSNLKTLSAGVPKETGRMPVPPWKPGPAFALLRFGVAGAKHRTFNLKTLSAGVPKKTGKMPVPPWELHSTLTLNPQLRLASRAGIQHPI
jgi:hypothetical protein